MKMHQGSLLTRPEDNITTKAYLTTMLSRTSRNLHYVIPWLQTEGVHLCCKGTGSVRREEAVKAHLQINYSTKIK